MKQWLFRLFARATRALQPKPDQSSQLRESAQREAFLAQKLSELAAMEAARDAEASFHSMVDDLVEARAMAGAGPWRVSEGVLAKTDKLIADLRESFRTKENAINNQGAYGDIELALQNVDWRREVNFSVLQFTRWGIQQIILIVRLYYIKNPIVRRLIDVCAAYVFARGVEVTTDDEAANETLEEFFESNRQTFGQVALVQAERMKDSDGNLFWVFFADKINTGKIKARMIDATEIDEIESNPEDIDEPQYFLRSWGQSIFDVHTGQKSTKIEHAWYPAMGFDPAEKPATIRGFPVMWDACIHHRKCGYIGKWNFGCPRAYPMVDWAKEARRFLEACASVQQSLMQIGLVLTSKGGQQAMMGAKQQLGTTVGPSSAIWDNNPPAIPGATFAAGTGTTLEAFKTQGAGGDPEKVRQYKLMCCMVSGVPETFLADVSTGNLATATSLDRPTETVFLEKQEAWREDLTIIAQFVLRTSAGAASGRLAEAHGLDAALQFREAPRTIGPRGECVYEALQPEKGIVQIRVNFPAIREGDVPQLVKATVDAMVLGGSQGAVVGIDKKVGRIALYNQLGIEGGEELAEQQEADDAKEKAELDAQMAQQQQAPEPAPGEMAEALAQIARRDLAGRPTRRG